MRRKWVNLFDKNNLTDKLELDPGGERKKETKGAMISSDAELLFLTVLPSSSCHPSFPCQDVRRVRRVRLADGVIVTAIG